MPPQSNNNPLTPDARQTYLITQALPYANGDIHLGHLVEAVQTDIFVRYQKLRGNKAVFVCADDTHGTPIEVAALKRKITPEQLIAEAHAGHVKDYARFSIGFDIFYTTNSEENRYYAEFIYQKLRENGLVVQKEITQYFCEQDKRFLPDRFVVGICPKCKSPDQYGDVCEVCGSTYDPTDLTDPQCILCRAKPVLKQSTHFFVELSKCESFLRDYLKDNVLSGEMKNFVDHWIDGGLKQWCISRDGPYFGFKIPGTNDKFFYVWLDAPIGYLSSTAKWCKDHGENIDTYWKAGADTSVVHFIGKDIVYFHALFWPVLLQNAGFNLPRKIFVHGFLTVAGEKMSKSRGTFILARDFADGIKHPQATEFLRFFFASKLTSGPGDIDLNKDEFCLRANTVLANNIGNLCHRTFVFCERYFEKKIPDAPWDEGIEKLVGEAEPEIARALDLVEYKTAVEKIQALGTIGNKYYQDSEPWKLIKTDPAAAAKVMVTCANLVKALAVFLKPMVPGLIASIERQLAKTLTWDDWSFSLRNYPLATVEKLVEPIEPSAFDALFAGMTVAAAAPAPESTPSLVDIATFKTVDLRVATILAAEKVKKSNKLLKLQVEIGGEKRQIIAGIAQHYEPETLIGRSVVVVANLKPAQLMGETSQGMLLAAQDGNRLVLIKPDGDAKSGAKVA
jgi:methionyl-tRNA synthetase